MIELSAPRRSPWFGVTGLVLVATLLAAIFVQVRQHALLSMTVQDQDDYTVLSLYQVEIEYLRLREQLRRIDQLAQVDGRAELQLRYDIFLSRVDLLKTVRASRVLSNLATGQNTIRELDSFSSRADLYLGSQPRATISESAAAALLADIERLGEPIHQLLLDASHHVAAQITARRDQVRQHNEAGLLLTAFLSAMVLIFAVIALRQMRQLETRREHLETLAQELRDARALADRASAAKSAFLADMSHELRTPLHGLLGMLSLARDAPRDARAATWLETADQSARHLQRLLDDVLDLAKLESGALTLVVQPVRLESLIQDVCALMQLQAEAKGLRLDVQIEAGLPPVVRLDATRLRQVLFNLLHNAIKYSEAGTIVLHGRSGVDREGRPVLEFDVSDNGIGMDTQALSQLFQRFSRIDDPLARQQGGAGLGLSISANLARLMGGDLGVRSTPGAGSVFTFRCALEHAEPLALAPVEPTPTLHRPLQILVAEDHPVNRMFLSALLARMGHHAQAVENGQEAVAAVQKQTFDLVLMDVHMPVMDGVSASAAIRALPQATSGMRIVALTADVFADTRERCLQAGINEVVSKPISAQGLSELLQRHFKIDFEPAGSAAADATPALPSLNPDLPLIDAVARAEVCDTMGQQRSQALYTGLLDQAAHAAAGMHLAMRDADVDALRSLAHSVKGAALNLGLPGLAEAAAQISGGAQAMAAPQLALAVQRFDEMLQATRSLCAAEGLTGTRTI